MKNIIITLGVGLFAALIVLFGFYSKSSNLNGDDEKVDEFVLRLTKVIEDGRIEGLDAMVFEAVPDQKSVDSFFAGHAMKLRSWEVRNIEAAKKEWGGLVVALLGGMDNLKRDDQVVWFYWSDVAEGEGRITLNQYLVITKNERGVFKVRIK